ncbi:MAG TPA: hypothetical protein VJR89_40290 [Polyangiales bacterium]|nr:hypothetical protein [Polyangiales bacterium]
MRLAILTAISCWAVLGVARAEPLPGSLQLDAGGHLMVLGAETCESDDDVVGCQLLSVFAGFELGARLQLGDWFALGLRAAGSTDLGSEELVSSDANGTILTAARSLWLWQLALEARFEPSIWPAGLWLGAAVGFALAVDSVSGAQQASHTQTVPLAAAVVGWDFAIESGFLFGIDLRLMYLALTDLPRLGFNLGAIELEPFPYVALGAHGGYRW